MTNYPETQEIIFKKYQHRNFPEGTTFSQIRLSAQFDDQPMAFLLLHERATNRYFPIVLKKIVRYNNPSDKLLEMHILKLIHKKINY